jgi:prevent-host-death family protein
MRSVGVDDAKTDIENLIDEVEHGEVIHLIKNGETVAKLVPGHGRVVDRLAEVFKKYPVDPEWADDLERTVRELRSTTTEQERRWDES